MQMHSDSQKLRRSFLALQLLTAGDLRRYTVVSMRKNMIQNQDVQEVNSWRIYSKVLGNRISVDLPENSGLQEVEIIILPIRRKTVSETMIGQEEWKNDFLTISRWDISEDDIRMKSWHIPEF